MNMMKYLIFLNFSFLGPKANLLNTGSAKLCVEFVGKRKSLDSSKLPCTPNDSKMSPKTEKTKGCVNSSNNTISVCNSQDHPQNGLPHKENSKLKRKKPIVEDSDSDDLDFGEKFTSKPAIKKRTSDKMKSSQLPYDTNQSESPNGVKGDSGSDSDFAIIENQDKPKKSKAIVIDSDSE